MSYKYQDGDYSLRLDVAASANLPREKLLRAVGKAIADCTESAVYVYQSESKIARTYKYEITGVEHTTPIPMLTREQHRLLQKFIASLESDNE